MHALKDVSVRFPAAEFAAVMGPSGSGKSTLLHCLAALDVPTSGKVFLGETEISALSHRERAYLRRDRIGFVFQAFNLVPTLDATENITLPQLLAGRSTDSGWIREVVDQVGLSNRLHHRPAQLSGGQQQRVAVARALAGRPEVIFADEPTGNLDTRAGHEVLSLLRAAADDNRQTIIMVTHDPMAAAYADRVVFLGDGQVVDELHRPTADAVLERLKHLDELLRGGRVREGDGRHPGGNGGAPRRARRELPPEVPPRAPGSGVPVTQGIDPLDTLPQSARQGGRALADVASPFPVVYGGVAGADVGAGEGRGRGGYAVTMGRDWRDDDARAQDEYGARRTGGRADASPRRAARAQPEEWPVEPRPAEPYEDYEDPAPPSSFLRRSSRRLDEPPARQNPRAREVDPVEPWPRQPVDDAEVERRLLDEVRALWNDPDERLLQHVRSAVTPPTGMRDFGPLQSSEPVERHPEPPVREPRPPRGELVRRRPLDDDFWREPEEWALGRPRASSEDEAVPGERVERRGPPPPVEGGPVRASADDDWLPPLQTSDPEPAERVRRAAEPVRPPVAPAPVERAGPENAPDLGSSFLQELEQRLVEHDGPSFREQLEQRLRDRHGPSFLERGTPGVSPTARLPELPSPHVDQPPERPGRPWDRRRPGTPEFGRPASPVVFPPAVNGSRPALPPPAVPEPPEPAPPTTGQGQEPQPEHGNGLPAARSVEQLLARLRSEPTEPRTPAPGPSPATTWQPLPRPAPPPEPERPAPPASSNGTNHSDDGFLPPARGGAEGLDIGPDSPPTVRGQRRG